jgi:hypothetical protein
MRKELILPYLEGRPMRPHMPQHRESDWFEKFNKYLARIKFVLFEVVIFIGFLMFLWDKVKHDVAFIPAGSPSAVVSMPIPSGSSPAPPAKPEEPNPRSNAQCTSTSP